MSTLAIRIASEGPLLIFRDGERGRAETIRLRDPFLAELVLDAELRLARGRSADP